MHAAHDQSVLIDALLLIIIIAYLGIAYQFWVRRKGTSGRATRALGQLVVIFVFCAVCGYVPRLIGLAHVQLDGWSEQLS
jgi:glycerol-3-phosphate acyltransferase PlsY